MLPELGKKYLITTTNWFHAPDGKMYNGVFGIISGIYNDEETLGIKTNKESANWYLVIGKMIVAGCRIHYCIRTDEVDDCDFIRDMEHQGRLTHGIEDGSRIYMAD